MLEEEITAWWRPVEGAHIERLVLVQRVLKESMRLSPGYRCSAASASPPRALAASTRPAPPW
jgi:hypothetical protein